MVFVDRLSNVLSWAGFLCAIPFIVVVLIVASSSLIDNLVEKKNPAEMGYNSAEVEVLTWKDIYNSNRLQELNAQVGDFVAKNELIRSRPSWISVYANSAEQMIGALGLIFVSIGTALINYLMVGSLRLLPWKPYSN